MSTSSVASSTAEYVFGYMTARRYGSAFTEGFGSAHDIKYENQESHSW